VCVCVWLALKSSHTTQSSLVYLLVVALITFIQLVEVVYIISRRQVLALNCFLHIILHFTMYEDFVSLHISLAKKHQNRDKKDKREQNSADPI
jgi:DMSO/TMAO reductase YedYZ heme-binding membrane subunit